MRVFGSADAGNVGIIQFQVRRSLVDPIGYEVLAVVKNSSPHAVQGRLELELDGVPVDVLPLNLAPDGVFSRSLHKTSIEGGTLAAQLTELRVASDSGSPVASRSGGSPQSESAMDINALMADDRALAILPARPIQRVALVTAGNLFLQKVFEANSLVQVTLHKQFPAAWPADSIIVLHRDIPDRLPGGDVFVVDPLRSCDVWELGESIEYPIVTAQDTNSPLMTHVRLDNVVMPQARQLTFRQPPRVLAGVVSGDAVYAEARRSNGKCLVLSVNIDEGDLAFRTAFPIMVTNALGWFAGQTGELRPSLQTGTVTELDLAGTPLRAAREIRLRSPAGDSLPLNMRRQSTGVEPPAEDASMSPTGQAPSVTIPPLDECGVWSIVRAAGGGSEEPIAELAVNLANESESDLRTPSRRIDEAPSRTAASWLTRPIWFYLAAATCLLAITEWWLYQRRVIT
jgi:hypothetical protein